MDDAVVGYPPARPRSPREYDSAIIIVCLVRAPYILNAEARDKSRSRTCASFYVVHIYSLWWCSIHRKHGGMTLETKVDDSFRCLCVKSSARSLLWTPTSGSKIYLHLLAKPLLLCNFHSTPQGELSPGRLHLRLRLPRTASQQLPWFRFQDEV